MLHCCDSKKMHWWTDKISSIRFLYIDFLCIHVVHLELFFFKPLTTRNSNEKRVCSNWLNFLKDVIVTWELSLYHLFFASYRKIVVVFLTELNLLLFSNYFNWIQMQPNELQNMSKYTNESINNSIITSRFVSYSFENWMTKKKNYLHYYFPVSIFQILKSSKLTHG